MRRSERLDRWTPDLAWQPTGSSRAVAWGGVLMSRRASSRMRPWFRSKTEWSETTTARGLNSARGDRELEVRAWRIGSEKPSAITIQKDDDRGIARPDLGRPRGRPTRSPTTKRIADSGVEINRNGWDRNVPPYFRHIKALPWGPGRGRPPPDGSGPSGPGTREWGPRTCVTPVTGP